MMLTKAGKATLENEALALRAEIQRIQSQLRHLDAILSMESSGTVEKSDGMVVSILKHQSPGAGFAAAIRTAITEAGGMKGKDVLAKMKSLGFAAGRPDEKFRNKVYAELYRQKKIGKLSKRAGKFFAVHAVQTQGSTEGRQAG